MRKRVGGEVGMVIGAGVAGEVGLGGENRGGGGGGGWLGWLGWLLIVGRLAAERKITTALGVEAGTGRMPSATRKMSTIPTDSLVFS